MFFLAVGVKRHMHLPRRQNHWQLNVNLGTFAQQVHPVIRIGRRKPPKRCPRNKTSEVNQFRLTAETCERGTGYVGGLDFYE